MKANESINKDYMFVKSNWKKPVITADLVKTQIKKFVLEHGVYADADAVETAFEPKCVYDDDEPRAKSIDEAIDELGLFDCISEGLDDWLWNEAVRINPDLYNNDKYIDAFRDLVNHWTAEKIAEITYGEIISLTDVKNIVLEAIK